VLAAVLDGYDGARLTRGLVRDQRVAVSAGASYDGRQPRPGAVLPARRARRRHQRRRRSPRPRCAPNCTRIADEGVSAAELRARQDAGRSPAQVYKRDSLMGQAMEIGMDEMVGLSWKLDAEMLERIRAVSAAEVQAVAKKYFRAETLTVAQLDPLPMNPQARAKAAAAPAAHRH
jgi:zinc protease